MDHYLRNDLANDKSLLYDIFTSIKESNTVLFLGAGASVTEDNKFLSTEIIELYEDLIDKKLDIKNITEFIDILETQDDFNRSHFDDFVFKLLDKLEPSETHNTIASIPWKDIITTNYDLLIEKAYDNVKSTPDCVKEIFPIKSVKQLNSSYIAGDQTRYIKLNGCSTDRSKYKYVFSSSDFENAKSFYNSVLNPLRNPSPKTQFLFSGYSFRDEFSKDFLNKFDTYRERRTIYSIDPYVNKNLYSFYKQRKIKIIQLSNQEFFDEYKKWENAYYKDLNKGNKVQFHDTNKSQIILSEKLSYALKSWIVQINENTRPSNFIDRKEYYLGEAPNYYCIQKNYDIQKQERLNEIKTSISELIEESNSNLIPIIFITGTFGSGKNSFAYRLLNQFSGDLHNANLCFEILDYNQINLKSFNELLEKSNAKNVFIMFNNCDFDSRFKKLLEFRHSISVNQPSKHIVFICTIRDNSLEIFKQSRNDITNSYEFNVDVPFNNEEINDLLENLKIEKLVNFRDQSEKKVLYNKIKDEYKGDSFISLLSLISNSNHKTYIIDAYNTISSECKKAIIYTALVHQFNLEMPASILKSIVSKDWEEFVDKVVKVEAKGILRQSYKKTVGTEPDLYFTTKHSVIAKCLIDDIIPERQKRFSMYREIIAKCINSDSNSFFINSLLKAIRSNKLLDDTQVRKLYDTAHKSFSTNPFFSLNYSIHLQNRGDFKSLKQGLDLLIYSESLLEKRNHKFIHRRAVINFKMAKIRFKEEKELNDTLIYLKEAKELFEVKKALDPCSSFSYVDYLNLLLWELNNIRHEKQDVLILRVRIEREIQNAQNSITEGGKYIREIKREYLRSFDNSLDSAGYLDKLNESYNDEELRPYSLILLYNYHRTNNQTEMLDDYISELEHSYLHIDEVVYFLFDIYSKKLNNPNVRAKFDRLISQNNSIEEKYPIDYYYFNFIFESYSRKFSKALQFLDKIDMNYSLINPDYQLDWLDPHSESPREFNGYIKKRRRIKVFHAEELQKDIWLNKETYSRVEEQDECTMKIKFHLNGWRAYHIEDK